MSDAGGEVAESVPAVTVVFASLLMVIGSVRSATVSRWAMSMPTDAPAPGGIPSSSVLVKVHRTPVMSAGSTVSGSAAGGPTGPSTQAPFT